MTDDIDLEKLIRASAQLNRVTLLLGEDPDVPESMLALLTAAGGCFTALIHIAGILEEINGVMVYSRLTKKDKEMMQ